MLINEKHLQKLSLNFLYGCLENKELVRKHILGTGCERVAFDLDNNLVLKISKKMFVNDGEYYEGKQTNREIEIWKELNEEERKLFNPILFIGEFQSEQYIIVPRIKTFGASLSIDNLEDYVQSQEIDYDFSLLQALAELHSLDYYDMIENNDNFGFNHLGEFVVSDFGLLK